MRSSVAYHKPDYLLLIIVAVIIVFGLIMISSAGTVVGYEKFHDSNYFLKQQLISFIIGAVVLLIAARLDYHILRKYAFSFLVISIVLLILVFIPGLGIKFLGATRWLNLGGILFQPTEIVKLAFLIYLASWFEKRNEVIHNFYYGFLPFIIVLGLIMGLIILQPDFGTMSVIALTALAVYFVGGAHWKHLILIILGGLAAFWLMIKLAPYRMSRVTVFLNPTLDPQGIGYHINQALLAIGSGGLFGLGLGHSRQKYNYLPQATGDSIFAIIAEELGFILVLGLIILFIILMVRGFRIAKNSPDSFGRLLATGITSWFAIQALINIAAMVALLPLTGIPLPFISYGGTALVISMAAVGILINISKQTREVSINH